ncbi:phosphatidylglycerophosphatase A [Aggregatibacter actinomycetemcomitans]|uniref:phosphatidylglycerophosphatase A family protein n=1 Tax=Aggregatibacter actinomycetemcomitans TaxID=714 RepID=UPI0001B9F745|nr:phosphatidylglycerophosphatase A [Aggregatibacter actinomycetemcomitans]ACX82381.1 phosphatidylglycerophosphatase [Aggregatibacter actinomycetemcomitans D11S-1]KOE58553.1 phosphatidylglycerophosphatase [Aggregatibacter actinomycetemcomitans serotype c str. AAS4A]KOE58625.1 phosphatidylglycerophosphatase [Aggregatibacter actinomycetemcomitans serotype c str. SCC2302]KOE58886.1 phosphatidylglycerophosphatase [Aggregatibacter actinomycetemcomitans serotype c str. D17P-2]KYK75876.1 phosphatidyl
MTSSQHPLERVNLRNPIHFFALGFGSGLLRPAPGTWGSLVGVILGALLLPALGAKTFFILTALCFFIGIWLCERTSHDMGVHDHGSIVWDEIVAVFLVLLAVPQVSLLWCAIAFVTFRLFDILKPYPIRYFDEKLTNGFGIMADDILAAGYSIVVILVLAHFI